MSGNYGQNNRTLNVDTLFVRDIYFRDFANNPIPANQPLLSRGDGGTYFTSSMTSTFAAPAINAITASTFGGGNYQFVASGPYNVFNFEAGGSTEFYSNSSNGGLIIYNTGPEQIIADGQVLPFAILPDYPIGGRTLQYVGTGDTTLQVSDATIFFNSVYYSSLSTVLFLQSTTAGLEDELNSSLNILNSLVTSSGLYNYNLISSYFLTPNVINISTVSTSLLILGDNTIKDNPLRDSIYDPCIVYTGSTLLSTNTDFLTFTDNFSGVTFAIDKEYLYATSTLYYGPSTTTVTRGQQVQLGWFPTLSTQTNTQSLRSQFVPVVQQIQVLEQLVSTGSYLGGGLYSTTTNYYMKNIGRFDEICNPTKISIIAPVIGATLRKNNLINNSWVQYDTTTSTLVWGNNGGTGTLPVASNYGDYVFWNGSAWVTGFSTISIGDRAGGGAATAEGQGEGAIAIGAAAGYSTQGAYSVAVGWLAGQYAQGAGSVAIGPVTGNSNQGVNSVAVGNSAGFISQGAYSIAIGDSAGYQQSTSGIAIGFYAGYSQGYNTIAIGTEAGYGYQNSNSVAIGNYAGGDVQDIESVAIGDSAGVTQSSFAVAIGYCAGTNNQNQGAIAIGSNAGSTIQGVSAVAIGTGAGQTLQGQSAVAIGSNAGTKNQGEFVVAVGAAAGYSTQGAYALAMGYTAGQYAQMETAVAIGNAAGNSNQGSNTVAIGNYAGGTAQGDLGIAIGNYAGSVAQQGAGIAIGVYAGQYNQQSNAIAIGNEAGNSNQQESAIAIGEGAGLNQSSCGIAIGLYAGCTQDQNAVAIGSYAGYNIQNENTVAIGNYAGGDVQDIESIAIGDYAGVIQSSFAVAIGYYAGNTRQNRGAVAIGSNTGLSNQGQFAVAVGAGAGASNQGTESIAIGNSAGYNNQSSFGIAIGYYAASNTQGFNAIAIGSNAGRIYQGDYAVAVGALAGYANQSTCTIVINATGAALNTVQASSFYVAPIRYDSTVTTSFLQYNTTTKEVVWNTGTSTMTQSLIPDVDNEYDIGTSTLRLRHLYVGPSSLTIGTGSISADNGGNLYATNAAGTTVPIGGGGGGGTLATDNFCVAVGYGPNYLAYSYDGLTWTPTPSSNPFVGGSGIFTRWNGSLWISGGYDSTISSNTLAYSSDGINWTSLSGESPFDSYFTCAAWNGTMWIGGGYNDGSAVTLASSYDGIHWTPIDFGFFGTCLGIAWNGSMWVAVGSGPFSGIYYSYNGFNWTSANVNYAVQCVAWNGQIWVAGAIDVTSDYNTIFYSYDGINWSSADSPLQLNCYCIAWNGSLWVAGAGEGPYNPEPNPSYATIAYSYDGITWSLSDSVFEFGCSSVVWNGSIFVVTGDDDVNSLGYSYNGDTFFPITNSVFPPGYTVFGISSRNILPYVGTSPAAMVIKPPTANFTVAVGDGPNYLAYSYDGVNWNGLGKGPFNANGAGNCVAWNGSLWLAGGYDQSGNSATIAYSSDGIHWALANSPFNNDCYCIAWNGSMWVAGGDENASLAYSYDGINWTSLGHSVFNILCNGVAWNGSMWVATGINDGGVPIYYSYDGINWTSGNQIVDSLLLFNIASCIAWNGTMWVLGGQASYAPSVLIIVYSYDGINWQVNESVNVFTDGCRCLAWNGYIWVAGGVGNDNETLAYSIDGINWTQADTQIFQYDCYSVAWNGSVWIAGGQDNTNTLAYSYDGMNWLGLGTTMFEGGNDCYGLASRNVLPYVGTSPVKAVIKNVTENFCVATGRGLNQTGYSYDGINWNSIKDNIFRNGNGNCVAWNGSYWLAGGTDTINASYTMAISSDGIHWANLETQFTSDCYAIAWNGNMWVAVGDESATAIYSYDGFNWYTTGLIGSDAIGWSVAWNGTMWVTCLAASGFPTIFYSYDGNNWVSANQTVAPYGPIFPTVAYCVAWNGKLWVAGGNSTYDPYVFTLAYSYDGINWSASGSPAFLNGCYCLAWNGTLWVAGGEDPSTNMGYSYDGLNWSAAENNIFSEWCNSVTWNGSYWIAVGVDATNTIAYSVDGINWTGLGTNTFTGSTDLSGGYGIASRTVLPYVGSSPIPFTRMSTIAYGTGAGGIAQGLYAVAIGAAAGYSTQGAYAVAIGQTAGQDTQGSNAVAIGWGAGQSNQGSQAVAIGNSAGLVSQSTQAVAIGLSAGILFQGPYAVAIGTNAGQNAQGDQAVAIGQNAGTISQGSNAVAIGLSAGRFSQRSNAIAIGYAAGSNNQSTNTIVINATGVALNTTYDNSLYIAPIRNDNTGYGNVLSYNTGTNEIIYDTTKTFVINHPKDESKYLVHACLEGPEAGVYYRGTGTIAELETSVVVELPDYVDALATDLTVQVTPIYNGSVRVLNASCVSNNKFTVYGDSGDFHWHVYGRRAVVIVEPKKSDVAVLGEGPYRWIA